MLCPYVVSLCCVLMLCTYVVYLCCVLMLCTYVVYLCCVLILCTYVVYLCCVLMLCPYFVYLCCVLMLCPYAFAEKLQSEMLRRSNEAEQENELLVPLAGLKQVTVDYYKAVIKTNSLRNNRPSYQPSSVGAVDIVLSLGVPAVSLAMCRPPVVHCLTLSIQAVRLRPGLSFPRLRLRLMLKLWLRLFRCPCLDSFRCPCLDSFHRFSCAYSLQTHQPVVGSVFVN